MKQMYYTYVLKSQKDGKMYTGSTKDLKLGFEQHGEGLVQSTKHRRPLELIYYEVYPVKCVLPLFNRGMSVRGGCIAQREVFENALRQNVLKEKAQILFHGVII